MVNYNQAYLESLVKPGSTRLSILVDNCQKPGKSGSTRVYQAHQAFNQTFGARVSPPRKTAPLNPPEAGITELFVKEDYHCLRSFRGMRRVRWG